MRWIFAALMAMEGLFVYQTFYSSSKVSNAVGFFCLVPTTLSLLFFLLVGLFMLIAVPLGWMGSSSDYQGTANRPADEEEEDAQPQKRSGWPLRSLADPMNPLSPYSPQGQEMLRPIHVEHEPINHIGDHY